MHSAIVQLIVIKIFNRSVALIITYVDTTACFHDICGNSSVISNCTYKQCINDTICSPRWKNCDNRFLEFRLFLFKSEFKGTVVIII